MSRKAVISAAVAPIHTEPSFSSEMSTQALMWESIIIQETDNNWQLIRMEDGYEGWIHSFYLDYCDPVFEEFIMVIERAVPVFHNIDKKDSIVALLSFGTYLPKVRIIDSFCKICLPNGQDAYIEMQEQVPTKNRETIIKFAELLIGVPYIWGGKSSFGYDCSGFVQMVLKTAGIDVQRDASQQIQTKDLAKINIDQGTCGDLLFFSEKNCINHVAFILGEGKIIHCSGQVKIESIIEGEPGFNKQLNQFDKTAMSISGIIAS